MSAGQEKCWNFDRGSTFLRRLLRNVFPTAGHLLFFRRRRSEKNKRNLGNRASIVQINGLNTAK